MKVLDVEQRSAWPRDQNPARPVFVQLTSQNFLMVGGKIWKELYFVKYIKFQFQCPLIVYWTNAMIICLGIVYGCSYVTTAELKSERDLLQSLKYLPSGPSHKTLPNPGGGGTFAFLEIRRKVGLPSNSAILSLEIQRVWTKLIPIFILSHLYTEWEGPKFMSLAQAGVKLWAQWNGTEVACKHWSS